MCLNVCVSLLSKIFNIEQSAKKVTRDAGVKKKTLKDRRWSGIAITPQICQFEQLTAANKSGGNIDQTPSLKWLRATRYRNKVKSESWIFTQRSTSCCYYKLYFGDLQRCASETLANYVTKCTLNLSECLKWFGNSFFFGLSLQPYLPYSSFCFNATRFEILVLDRAKIFITMARKSIFLNTILFKPFPSNESDNWKENISGFFRSVSVRIAFISCTIHFWKPILNGKLKTSEKKDFTNWKLWILFITVVQI